MVQYSHVVVSVLFFSLLIVTIPSPSFCQSNNTLTDYCTRDLSCGNIQNVVSPFWGDPMRPQNCGQTEFELRCINNDHFVIDIDKIEHRVLRINQKNNSMVLARSDMWSDVCSPALKNTTTLNTSFFSYPPNVANLTLVYGCQRDFDDRRLVPYGNVSSCGARGNIYLYLNDTLRNLESTPLVTNCKGEILQVPIDSVVLAQIVGGTMGVVEGLRKGFQVKYMEFGLCGQCIASGGLCDYSSAKQFLCSCHGTPLVSTLCFTSPGRTERTKAIIGIVSGGIVILLVLIALCLYKNTKSQNIPFNLANKGRDVEAFIRSNGHQTAKRYKFSDVKKMTKSFKDKLGQGGFGEVYKGELSDGRLVAVKLLNSSKDNGEGFINEVASISRTSHVNIVMLLGFCLEGRKRALIYEFMPNGSLEKFIFNENSSQTNPNLEWNKHIQIATGIARGLEYLHRGCNTRILHFDIKPHNILLDEDLCPKISDFGLSKLCPEKQSKISLLDARGTIGYIAPEVFNRNFGVVSSKSDVYSFGMMVLEMVGGRKNIEVVVSRTSEIYFPDWIYKHLEIGDKLKIWGDMTSDENGIAKKMIIVGLWCIQIAPSDRPTMSKVIEMLEGSLEALQTPPKPTFFSSERHSAELETESSST